MEFGSNDPAEADNSARQLIEQLKQSADPPNVRLYTKAEARHVWKLREAGPRAAAAAPGSPPEWEGWDDAAVPPEKLGNYLRDIRKLLDEYHYHTSFYGHFGHGCIHMRVSFDLQSENGIRNYLRICRARRRFSGPLWRVAFRRAWRRTVPRRVASQNVRSRADESLRGI